MSDTAKIEAEADGYLTAFKGLFKKIMKARGGTHKWEDVVKDRSQLREVARLMLKRRKFKRGKTGPIEKVSLFCSKIDELRPFRLENYSDERDINACLNSMYFYSAVAEICRQDEEDGLVRQGTWKKGVEIKVRPKLSTVFNDLYQDFLLGELSEDRLKKLAEDLLDNLHADIHWPDKPK